MASPKVVAAGHALASWVRARRAEWTGPTMASGLPRSEPAPRADLPLEFGAPAEEEFELPPLPVFPVSKPKPASARPPKATPQPIEAAPPTPMPARVIAPPPPPPTPASVPIPVHIASAPPLPPPPPSPPIAVQPKRIEHLSDLQPEPIAQAVDAPKAPPPAAPRTFQLAEERSPWIGRAVAAAAAIAIVGGGYYLWSRTRVIETARGKVAEIANKATAPAPTPPKTSGSLRITSTPDGARVIVDGKPRGVTPLTLEDLSFGTHAVVLQSAQGTVERKVEIVPDRPAALDEAIFAGWVTIFSPIEISVFDGPRSLRPDDRNEIMLAAGRHELRFENRALAFSQVRAVDVAPGERQRVTITPPKSSIAVTASESAEVWVDGARLGQTPLPPTPIDVGTHELLVKRASGGERKSTITVTVRPFATSIEF